MQLARYCCCVLVLIAVACADQRSGSSGAAGGTLVIAAPPASDPLLPPLANVQTTRQVTDNLFETLAEIGPQLGTVGDAGFEPRLARSWEWSPDSTSIAFSIDPRARWHDGQPVRASDVRYTLSVLKDPRTASAVTTLITNIDSITVRDSLTAVVWFHRRTPEQFYDIAYQVRIIPEHVLKDIPNDKLATSDAARRPIGSGRFRFVRWDPGTRIEVVADTAHYRGRPKLDRVIWSFAPDANTMVTQLLSGQADYFENLPASLVPKLDSSGQAKAVRYPGMLYSFMGFNHNDPRRLSAPHPIFGDVRVRRAMSMALDRQAMLQNVFDTLGVLGSGPYPRALADTAVAVPAFDRAAAGALLDSAGWRAGPDGTRARNGRPFAFTIMVPNSSSARMRYAVLIQEQLKLVGARVDIDALAFPEFADRQGKRNFDAAMMTVGTDPSPGSVQQLWGADAVNGGVNFVGYVSRAFDALIDSAQASFDPVTARQYYRRAYRTIVDDAPAVWLYDVLTMAGAHKRIRAERMRADAWWSGLAEFWIPENERIERDQIGLRPAQP
jgi:peptide/nickel transport system substrate-binding protein